MKRPIENGIRPWQQMLSSGTGAIVTALFMTPMDVVKTRLQVQKKPLFSGQCFVYCNGLMDHLCTCINGKTGIKPWYKLPGHFNGTFDALVKIARHEGLKSLWSGLPPTMLMAVPATVIYFTTYDQLKLLLGRMLNNQNPSKIWYIPMLAGTIARVGAVTVISPLELIRTKMQSRSLTYVELKDCVRAALVKEGWLSLWKGWSATVLRDVPFSALYWCNYEIFKSYLCRRYGVTEANFTISFTAGAASGTIAAVATLPFDVVKTHRQIEIGEIESLQHNKKPSSTLAIMKKIHMENGYRGLFAGITPRIIKVAPACAIMISSYEFGKRFFRRRNQGHLEKP
ncbi:mitochondrial glutathione transporter SLC25A40-like isoform X2 [Ptychodera flava]|uniref:mitochondrial glutathione transporter SLC25A40-like isoform X2 n=1 Tax=Ptychodera flava TaxID=63121 RepID=UPI00396AA353